MTKQKRNIYIYTQNSLVMQLVTLSLLKRQICANIANIMLKSCTLNNYCEDNIMECTSYCYSLTNLF